MSATAQAGVDQSPRAGFGLRRWQLWSIPAPGLAYILAVELLAGVIAAVALSRSHPTGSDLVRMLLLVGLGGFYAEAADRIERLRRYLGSGQVWSDQISVWTFAGALLLPAGCAGLVVALSYAHVLWRARPHQAARPHREVFTCATAMLGIMAAAAVNDYVVGRHASSSFLAAGAAAALITCAVVSLLAMVSGVYLAMRPPTLQAVLPGRDEITFELSMLVLGIVVAEFAVHVVWLVPSVALLIALLHRSALVTQLQVAAATDAKTGLLNAEAWRQRAHEHLSRSQRDDQPAGVLFLDLDHFKAVNDTCGHLAGDAVLRAVADCLKHELRGYDAVGRSGGEEFVAFLPGVTPEIALTIGERVRHRISTLDFADGLQVTASIGVAHFPSDAGELDALLAAADAALYSAKATGRDRVVAARGRP